MLQLLTVVVCAWLGWRRDPFLRWPIAVIMLAAVGSAALIMPGHPRGPELDTLLLRYIVSIIAFALAAYWLAWLVSGRRKRARD